VEKKKKGVRQEKNRTIFPFLTVANANAMQS